MPLQLVPMQPARDKDTMSRALALAFASPPEALRDWMANAGEENFRVLTDGTTPLATLLRIPMGQYFASKPIPMLGIAGVAVAPEHRGGGHAKKMMQHAMIQAAGEGWPLAGLYASTHTLYRAVGFEHAGHRFQYTIPIIRIDVRDAAGTIVPITDADMPRVHACYAKFAATFTGPLDRGPYIWNRIRKHREETYHGFAVENDSHEFEGYVFLAQKRRPDGRQDLSLSDFSFNTPAAGRRLWSLLADFAPMGEELTFFGGPTHPALELLQQQRHRVEQKDSWLIRILDVPKALKARGYSPACNAELHLDIHDDLIPANNARFMLRVEGGTGTVRQGGHGTLRTTIRGLAAIYSGFLSPRQGRQLGHVEATDESCDLAWGVFATTTPWMSDMF